MQYPILNNFTELWWLEKIGLFDGSSEQEIQKVEECSTMKTKEKGMHIYFPNESSRIIFFLKNGRVKIGSQMNEGNEIIKTTHLHDMIGEMGLVAGGSMERVSFPISRKNK